MARFDAWSLGVSLCLLIAAPAGAVIHPTEAPIGGLAGYVDESGEQRVVVLSRGHLIDLRRRAGPPTRTTLGYFEAPRGVAGHALAAAFSARGMPRGAVITADGRLTVLSYDDRPSEQGGILATLAPNAAADIASFSVSRLRVTTEHLLTATLDGAVAEIVIRPGGAVENHSLATFTGSRVVAVAGFTDPRAGEHVAVVALDGNEVVEIRYRDDGSVIDRKSLGRLPGTIVDLGAFFSTDDNFRHVLAATGDGGVTELFYTSAASVGRVEIARFGARPTAIDGYFTAADGRRHALVGLADGELREIAYHPALPTTNELVTSFALPPATFTQDISPDVALGQTGDQNPRASSAGMTLAVAGNAHELYALSPNAGLWKSLDGSPWFKLLSSPRYAYSLAVDPGNAAHLVVGERSGDAVDPRLEQVGVWESTDAGASWRYLLDPLVFPISCKARYVNAVTFGQPNRGLATLFVTTPCGVARKAPGGEWSLAKFPGLEPGGLATGLSEDGKRTVIAARLFLEPLETSDGAIAFSEDDGVTWKVRTLPTTVGAAKLAWGSRGDQFSVAAFDRRIFTIVTDVTDPAAPRPSLLFHDIDSDTWSLQRLNSGDGTGLGGRRFVKAFLSEDKARPYAVGGRIQLFASNGNDLERATADLGGGVYRWELVAPIRSRNVHHDYWDVHLETDDHFASPAVWLANDGGIAEASGFAVPLAWQIRVRGLHTHHIHDFQLLAEGSLRRPKLVYSTSDNDQWFRRGHFFVDPPTSFRVWGVGSGLLGDSNVTWADTGSPRLAMIARNLLDATLTDFGETPPPGAVGASDGSSFAIDCGQRAVDPAGVPFCNGLRSIGKIRVIQTPLGEPAEPLLDVVMMVKLPMTMWDPVRRDVVPVPGPLGATSSGGAPVLIRRRQFAAAPGPAVGQHLFDPANGWELIQPNPPFIVDLAWVAGGHARPTYFAADIGGSLFRLSPGASAWDTVYEGLTDGVVNAFPNPYDPRHIVLRTEATTKVTVDGGLGWVEDPKLEALSTASGKFPRDYYRGGDFGRTGAALSHANEMSSLHHIAFNRENPHEMVAVCPLTGVFHAGDDRRLWRKITAGLGTQIPSWAAIDGDSIYVSTEGNGIHRAGNFRGLPPEIVDPTLAGEGRTHSPRAK